MRAEIISTGTELLLGEVVNTSAVYLSSQLTGLGIQVLHHTTVGDHEGRITQALETALHRADFVFLTGGTGPTKDDCSKRVAAEVFHAGWKLSFPVLEHLKRFYQTKGSLPVDAERQAYLPQSARILPNRCGTAPGILLEERGKYCFVLPGPPLELQDMFEREVCGRLQKITGQSHEKMHRIVLKVFGLSESELEKELESFSDSGVALTIIDKHTCLDLHLSLIGGQNELRHLGGITAKVKEKLGIYVFGEGETTQSEQIVRLLRQRGETLATAESCSGGLLGGRLTDSPGSSECYLGGVVSYANEVKRQLLGVKESSLRDFGAVSPRVASEMAEGVRLSLGSYWGISTTGIAGPAGGTADKPVGLVYIGISDPQETVVEKCNFTGTRDSIRQWVVETALFLLRKRISEK